MKQVGGFWLPDADRHFKLFEELARYQEGVREAALEQVQGRELAVDGGAHVGIFSKWMASRFEQVLAVEPEPNNYRCLLRNIDDNVLPIRAALGQLRGWGRIERRTPDNSGDVRVSRCGAPTDLTRPFTVPVMKLDKILAKRLPGIPVRLIKLDVQGAELAALHGADHTLALWSPVLIVECTADVPPPHRPDEHLQRLGYRRVATIRKDHVWSRP